GSGGGLGIVTKSSPTADRHAPIVRAHNDQRHIATSKLERTSRATAGISSLPARQSIGDGRHGRGLLGYHAGRPGSREAGGHQTALARARSGSGIRRDVSRRGSAVAAPESP